jgi:hypothetical protein
LEIAVAVSKLSPVHIITEIPAFLTYFTDSTIVSLRGSWIPNRPIAIKFYSRPERLSAGVSKSLCSDFKFSYSYLDISL